MQFDFKDTVPISEKDILAEGKRLEPYITEMKDIVLHGGYDSLEASVNLPSDETFLAVSKGLAQKYASDDIRVLFVIGIGGSNLGTKAVYDALIGHFSAIETHAFPRVVFLDTVNHTYLVQLKNYLSENAIAPEQFLINVITKSGSTSETIMNLELLLTMLPEATSRLVITTDEGSKLDTMASEKNIPILHIPKNVGGRFSVLSNVGLFPLELIGINTEKLLEGARDARDKNISEDILYNPAAVSAIILYLSAKKGFVINDNFFFNAELESIGKWYRQLMGESIGKNGTGITPMVSIGSTDLHSMVQLYLGGPKNILTTFYWAPSNSYRKGAEIPVPDDRMFPDLVPDITGKKASEMLYLILKGTQASYKNSGNPFTELVMDDISEFTLGKLMQFKMLEMMYLGKLLGVNTFDQPNVEEYKEETRKLLGA